MLAASGPLLSLSRQHFHLTSPLWAIPGAGRCPSAGPSAPPTAPHVWRDPSQGRGCSWAWSRVPAGAGWAGEPGDLEWRRLGCSDCCVLFRLPPLPWSWLSGLPRQQCSPSPSSPRGLRRPDSARWLELCGSSSRGKRCPPGRVRAGISEVLGRSSSLEALNRQHALCPAALGIRLRM